MSYPVCKGKTLKKCSHTHHCQIVHGNTKRYCRRLRKTCFNKSSVDCEKSRKCKYAYGDEREYCRRKPKTVSRKRRTTNSTRSFPLLNLVELRKANANK